MEMISSYEAIAVFRLVIAPVIWLMVPITPMFIGLFRFRLGVWLTYWMFVICMCFSIWMWQHMIIVTP